VRPIYSNYGDRCFAAACLKLWNSFPAELRQAESNFQWFKRLLKTFLFGCWDHGTLWPTVNAAPHMFPYLLNYLEVASNNNWLIDWLIWPSKRFIDILINRSINQLIDLLTVLVGEEDAEGASKSWGNSVELKGLRASTAAASTGQGWNKGLLSQWALSLCHIVCFIHARLHILHAILTWYLRAVQFVIKLFSLFFFSFDQQIVTFLCISGLV